MKERLKEKLFPPVLTEYRVDLMAENYRALRFLLFFGAAISLLVLLMEQIIGPLEDYGHMIEMLGFFLCSLPLYFAFRKEIEDNATIILYIWASALLGWAIFVGTVFIPERETFVFLFLIIAVPMLIRDAPGRIFALIGIASVLYLVVDASVKLPEVFRADLYHLLGCAAISSVFSYLMMIDRLGYMQENTHAETEAEHDGLTGILNRRGGEQMIRAYLANGMTGSFLLMDVDNFKHINDDYGHARGDEVLKEVAACLRRHFRDTDVVMRMGGDEFIVYAIGMADARFVERKLEQVRLDMHSIVLNQELQDTVSVSMGCAINLGTFPGFDPLFKAADQLLYYTKENGKDGFSISDKDYDPEALK